jgi:hypothetical protein
LLYESIAVKIKYFMTLYIVSPDDGSMGAETCCRQYCKLIDSVDTNVEVSCLFDCCVDRYIKTNI